MIYSTTSWARPTWSTSRPTTTVMAWKPATGEGYEYHLQGTVLKYIWRYRYKGKPQEDLKKARWYLDRLIEEYDDAETP